MRWSTGRRTLATCAVAYFAVRMGQLVVSPALPSIAAALDLDPAVLGATLSGMWAAYAAMQLPSGLLAGRVGARKTVALAAAVVAGASLVLAAASGLWSFVAGVIGLGIGAGLYYNAAANLLARDLDGLGTALGLHKLGSRFAGLVAPLVATAVLLRGDWRGVPLVATGVAVAAAVAVLAFVPAAPASATDGGRATPRRRLRETLALLRRPEVAWTTAVTAVGEFVEQATMSFLPAALIAHYGVSVAVAGSLFSLQFGAAAVAAPVMGWVADRTDALVGASVPALVGVVGFGILATGSGVRALPVAVVLTGLSMGWTAPLQSRVLRVLPDDDRGRGFGAYRTVYLFVGSAGSAVVGGVAATAGWAVAFATLAGLLAAVTLGLGLERAVGSRRRPD